MTRTAALETSVQDSTRARQAVGMVMRRLRRLGNRDDAADSGRES